ncbi:hypothetical protein HC256_000656 [Beauveria bassiana]|nr:hypothetical protein HC256_000656 [Beauveria bassiana]
MPSLYTYAAAPNEARYNSPSSVNSSMSLDTSNEHDTYEESYSQATGLVALSKDPQRLFVNGNIDSKRTADNSPKIETAAPSVYPDRDEITVPDDGRSTKS